MKNLLLLITLGFFSLTATSFAAETIGEKVQVKSRDIERAATEKMNRLEEAVCMESDVECLAKKANNRAEEAEEAVEDKAIELKNKIDN